MSLLVTPSADFTKAVTARQIPFFASPGNANMPLQSARLACHSMFWGPSGATAGNLSGNEGALTTAGTFAAVAPSSTNAYTAQRRGTYATVVTTPNQQVGIRSPSLVSWGRGNSVGLGGFLFVCRFGFEAWTAGDRLFVGLANAGAALTTSDPSATVSMVGFGIDAGDTAITFMHNDGTGTATKDTISGQPTLAANQGYAAFIFVKPNPDGTIVYYRLDDFNAGTTIIDTSTGTDLPANTVFMQEAAVMGNAANTLVTAASIGISALYVEGDD